MLPAFFCALFKKENSCDHVRMSSRLPSWLLQHPIAHRGLHDGSANADATTKAVIENSMAAFRAAEAAGYPVELDVRLSQDGDAVVFHDMTLDRLTSESARVDAVDASAMSSFKLKNTSETIPLLRDVVAEISTPLLIEIKNDGEVGALESATWKILKDCGRGFAIQSFNPDTLGWFRDHAESVCRGLLSGDFAGLPLPEPIRKRLSSMEAAAEVAPDFIGYDVRCLPRKAVAKERESGRPILGWTVKSAGDWEKARAHCDNMIFEGFRPEGSTPDGT